MIVLLFEVVVEGVRARVVAARGECSSDEADRPRCRVLDAREHLALFLSRH